MKCILPYFFFAILLTSCNITSFNSESDKSEAEAITNKFYHHLEMNDFEKADKLFSEKFFEETDVEKLHKIYDYTLKEGGNLKNFILLEWNTLVVKGTDSKAEYVLLYNVEREKKNTTERIGLIKENDTIKIVSYYVNMDMLGE